MVLYVGPFFSFFFFFGILFLFFYQCLDNESLFVVHYVGCELVLSFFCVVLFSHFLF